VRPLLAALVALLVLMPAAALADGDPASDVLIDNRVFYPYYDKVPKASQAELQKTIADAKAKGYAVRVAMIGKVYDLGSAGLLYKKPQPYSQFLAQELAQFNRDWVLVVMPNGYGIYRCVPKPNVGPCETAAPSKPDQAALAKLVSKDKGGKDYGLTAEAAVKALAKVHGVSLGGGGAPIVPIAIGVAVVLAGGGAALLLARRRRSSQSV
jgi:hypothetical protein